MSLRLIACVALTALAALLAPQVAGASTSQLSLFQDDQELFGERGVSESPEAAMAEMKALGADVLRTNVLFYRTYKRSLRATKKPGGINLSNPNDTSVYDWSKTDRIIALARQHGIKVLATISGPGPRWSSDEPSRCTRGKTRAIPCVWKPNSKYFGQFVAAAAKRYKGQIEWYSLYNEPNLHTWILPESERKRGVGTIETSAIYYRKLWFAGYKAIAKYDRARRNRVLFGEVAAIGFPLRLLNGALCLNPRTGKKMTGALRAAYKCSTRPAKLNIGGYAIHPYNFGAFGNPQSKTRNKEALQLAYLPRLTRMAARAARAGRTPGRRGIYVTEFGYQTNPPDPNGVSPANQAKYINESDRLFWGSGSVKMVSQYELVDVQAKDQFNSGLRFVGGTKKPAYDAYRLPLVVTRRSSNSVEVWGQVRPGGGSQQPEVQVNTGGGFATVARPTTNSAGYFRINLSQPSTAEFRLLWTDVSNIFQPVQHTSRIAKAGKKLVFYKN